MSKTLENRIYVKCSYDDVQVDIDGQNKTPYLVLPHSTTVPVFALRSVKVRILKRVSVYVPPYVLSPSLVPKTEGMALRRRYRTSFQSAGVL